MKRLFQGLNPRYLLIFVISGALALAQILLYQQRIAQEGGGFKPDFIAYYTVATLAESARSPYDMRHKACCRCMVSASTRITVLRLTPFSLLRYRSA